ncbi:MAG: four helix bundle protein [Vicinamibacterales bacterium]
MPGPAVVDYRQRSFAFACEIVRFYRLISKRHDVPLPIAKQLLRSGCSIGANLQEAKSAQSRRDLVSKFSIALKEARETQYWLRLMASTGLATETELASLEQEATQLVAILTTSVKRLKIPPEF